MKTKTVKWNQRYIEWLDGKSFWCKIGFHIYGETKREPYFTNTGEYINGNPIQRKAYYSICNCEYCGIEKVY